MKSADVCFCSHLGDAAAAGPSAQVWDAPTQIMAAKVSPPPTAVGTLSLVVLPMPSGPMRFSPAPGQRGHKACSAYTAHQAWGGKPPTDPHRRPGCYATVLQLPG